MANSDDEIEILLMAENISDPKPLLFALSQATVNQRLLHEKNSVASRDFIALSPFVGWDTKRFPTAILRHLKMPRINGMHGVRKRKTNIYTNHIPAGIMTSSEESRIAVKAAGRAKPALQHSRFN